MSKPLVLTCDIGTQSARALLVDPDGRIVDVVQSKYAEPYFSKEPGWAEQKPNFYFDRLCECCRELCARSNALLPDVIAMTITVIRDTVVCLDANNEPLRDIILWLDKRTVDPNGAMPAKNMMLFKVAGMEPTAKVVYAASVGNWIMRHEPEIWARTAKYVMLPTYLNYKLTGNLIDSASNQIGHIPFDYKNRRWMKPGSLTRCFCDVPNEKLCDLVPSGTVIGTVTEEVCALTGIPAGLPLISTGSDKGCETLGLAVVDSDKASISLGTTATIQFSTTEYVEPQQFLPAYPGVLNDHYNPEIEIYRGLWLLSWFVKEFGTADAIDAKEKGIAPEALLRQYERLLDRIAAESPATQVFIQSPLPLDEARNEPYFTGKNARIEAFDRLLRRMAARRGLKFIDIRSRMLRDGKLPAEYTVDGIHLTPAGYAVWVEALRPYVTPAGARIGTVTCAGRGLAGVVVSDGDNCAATDSAGRFVLPANDRARFVFVSTPAGYASPSEEGVVRHYLPAKSDGSSHDFRLRRKPSGETRHGFVVVADPQLFARKEFRLLERAAEDIRQTAAAAERSGRPMHGICAGDITSGDHTFYTSYNEVMSATGITFRNAMGNHDMKVYGRSYETSFSKFEEMYGPVYYSFDVGRIHYVVLDDNFFIGRDYFYIGYLEERQMRWLEKDLARVQPGSTVVVCLHIPSTCEEQDRKQFRYDRAGSTMTNHRGLYEILKPYRAHIISGHTHTTFNQPIAPGLYEHVTPALSGAWWQGPLCTDGTPAGYGVYEVNGDRIDWYYKSTGYPADYQMKIYSGREYPQFEGYAVANVWASDPAWEVEFTIDGVPCGPAERFQAYDPAAKQMYSDTSQMDHKWIYPSISDHYYRVALPEGAKRVEVSATDRFGRISRAAVDLK